MQLRSCFCLAGLLLGLFSWSTPAAHASKQRVSKIERQHNQALRKIERAWLRHHDVVPLAKPTVVLEHRDGAKLVFKSGIVGLPLLGSVEAFVVEGESRPSCSSSAAGSPRPRGPSWPRSSAQR